MVITAWIMPLRKNKKRYLAHSACLIQMSKSIAVEIGNQLNRYTYTNTYR